MSEVLGNNRRLIANPPDIGIMAMMRRLLRGVPGLTGGSTPAPRFRPTGVPYRGKDRAPLLKPNRNRANQKSPYTQYGPMARRRRQIERGQLTAANGLFCAR